MPFGALRDRIIDEMVRPDLSAQIGLAINDAVKEASNYSFWFNEVRGLTFPTVAGQNFYDSTALSTIPYIGRIDSLWIVNNGQRMNLRLDNALNIEDAQDYTTGFVGQPYLYARYADGLWFYMTPDKVYTVGIDGTTRFAPLALDADQNGYTEQGETYIRANAKARVFENVVRDFDEADRQWQLSERERNSLLAQTGQRLSTGRNRASW